MQKSNSAIDSHQFKANLHAVRQANLRLLLREFSQARIAAGEPTNGTERAFAEQLQMSKSLLSQLKTSRNISDAIALQIEACCKKPSGWLSEERLDAAPRPAPGEEAFINLARQLYREQGAQGREKMRAALTAFR
jgi:hypothetical protein